MYYFFRWVTVCTRLNSCWWWIWWYLQSRSIYRIYTLCADWCFHFYSRLLPISCISEKAIVTKLRWNRWNGAVPLLSAQCIQVILERCSPWPHVIIRHISRRYRQWLSQLLSLWCHSHYDVIRYWAGHSQHYVLTYGHFTTFNTVFQNSNHYNYGISYQN